MRSNTAMSLDTIRDLAPAVFSTERDPDRTSDQYTFVSTEEVLMGMLDAGYGVFSAQQKRTRQSADMAYTRHLLRFRPLEWEKALDGDSTPEIILLSAHDGKCSFQLMAGLFRFVCENGIIVGQRFATIRTTHKGDIVEEVKAGAEKVIEFAPRMFDFQQKCLEVELSRGGQEHYASRAMRIRHGDATPYEPAELLRHNRPEDQGPSLWHTYQRVQENLMRGGVEGTTATGRSMTSRPINRVTKDVIYNRALWDLTEEYAEAA